MTTVPVSDLDTAAKATTINFREKSRKLPANWTLEKCSLHELTQYRCTSTATLLQRQAVDGQQSAAIECWPFVRLFRRCVDGRGKTFHVETTRWEGEYMWELEEGKKC